jgi:hypothetical protein
MREWMCIWWRPLHAALAIQPGAWSPRRCVASRLSKPYPLLTADSPQAHQVSHRTSGQVQAARDQPEVIVMGARDTAISGGRQGRRWADEPRGRMGEAERDARDR